MADVEHHERENYFRHSMLVVDHSKDALNSLIDKDLSEKKLTLKNFLDLKKHEIYHSCFNEKCCKCLTGRTTRKSNCLTKAQFDVLYYKRNNTSCTKTGSVYHVCCIEVQPDISIEVIDITLSRWLLVNYCNEVFWNKCLEGSILEDYLNIKKHVLYHYWEFNTSCCSCPNHFQLPARQVINEKQFEMMYPRCSVLPACRKRNYIGKTKCICTKSAKPGIRESELYPELQQKLLENMVPARKSVETLIRIRNNSYGHIPNTRISNEVYSKIRTETENALLEIGRFCGKESQVKAAINKVYQQPLDFDLMSKYTKTLSESDEAISYIRKLEGNTRQLEEKTVNRMATEIGKILKEKLESIVPLHNPESAPKYDVEGISKKNSPEQRFIRCAMVVVHVFQSIMQEIMKQSAIPPDTLFNLLQNDERFQRIMPKMEQDAYGLKSLATDGYTKLHIIYIFNIVRYYGNLFIPTPEQGWDRDPNHEDIGIGDDTQRMRKMRNKIVTSPSKTLSKEEFKEFSTRMFAIGARVDEYFKCKTCVTSFHKRISDFLHDHIDKEIEEKTLEQIFCLEDVMNNM